MATVARKTEQRRAIGIVRVSDVGDREGDSFTSPDTQRERIEDACKRDDIALIRIEDERNVSGGTPLAKREGLRSAVEAVEHGEADVIVAAYFDRLVRSLKVQAELVERVESAGGSVLALDTGTVTNGSAGQWLSANMLGMVGMVAEYQRRQAAERTADAKRNAVERGVVPFIAPPGYRRGEDGRLVVHEHEAKAVARAFELRAKGATIAEIRAHLAEHGIRRTERGVYTLLGSRVVLGEIRLGELVNREAHTAIVERPLWERVQRLRKDPPPHSRSERLLARLSVLRCAACGTRMTVGSQTHGGKRYPYYRCASPDCEQRVSIAAEKIEALIISETKLALEGLKGTARGDDERLSAEAELERAQTALDEAIDNLADLMAEPGAKAKLDQFRAARDEARENVARFIDSEEVLRITAAANWDDLTTDERRQLIQAMIARAVVRPGRGEDRVTIEHN